MKNNVIQIFVDSVVWECLGTTRAKISATPFLDSLKSESLVANNLYSHGPYTDAATRSLFTGRNCLDDFGYFYKLNSSPTNHYKMFHDAGYETYDFHYPYYVKGDKVRESIDHTIYTAGYAFASEWGGIFNYYFELAKTRGLNDVEYLLLASRMEYMFQSWRSYLEDIINTPETTIQHRLEFDKYESRNALCKLSKEIEKFHNNQKEYLNDFLKQGKEHLLAHLDTTSMRSYVDPNFMRDFVEKEYNWFFRKITRQNFKAYWWKNRPTISRITKAFVKYCKTRDSSVFTFIINYFGCLTSMPLMKKRWKLNSWQGGHPAKTHFDNALDLLKKRKSEKPFYMFFHVCEPHNNLAFFTYDTQDKDVIREDMNVLIDYVNQLGTDFKGNLIYFLSLRYTDWQIEKFCKSLKELGLWDTTTIMYVSDHGSSYTYYPLHNTRVNCFDDECYHIPLVIRHPGMKPVEINSYQYSKDVLPTLLDIVGIDIPSAVKGSSMLKVQKNRPYVVTEYMGPGCPDISGRRIWFSARDMKYVVAYKVGIYEDFEAGELAEVYDLQKDPQALYNINDKITKEAILYLLDPIRERYNEIKKDTYEFIDNLKENYKL